MLRFKVGSAAYMYLYKNNASFTMHGKHKLYFYNAAYPRYLCYLSLMENARDKATYTCLLVYNSRMRVTYIYFFNVRIIPETPQLDVQCYTFMYHHAFTVIRYSQLMNRSYFFVKTCTFTRTSAISNTVPLPHGVRLNPSLLYMNVAQVCSFFKFVQDSKTVLRTHVSELTKLNVSVYTIQ